MKKIIISLLKKVGYSLVKLKVESPKEVEKVLEKGNVILSKITPDNTILNGPFKGVRYTADKITEATLVPKLVGSYEAQLHDIVEEVLHKPYTDIIDIGCAEGYYAIGFAKRMPHTTVHCYDINVKDIETCKAIAALNGLTNLTFNYACTGSTLINFSFKGKGLVFCDAEGFELELFSDAVIKSLARHDLIIEVHDIINPDISNTLYNRFKNTHSIRVVDNRNLNYSNYEGLENLSADEKEFAFFEHRGGYNMNVHMEWFYMVSKSG